MNFDFVGLNTFHGYIDNELVSFHYRDIAMTVPIYLIIPDENIFTVMSAKLLITFVITWFKNSGEYLFEVLFIY